MVCELIGVEMEVSVKFRNKSFSISGDVIRMFKSGKDQESEVTLE